MSNLSPEPSLLNLLLPWLCSSGLTRVSRSSRCARGSSWRLTTAMRRILSTTGHSIPSSSYGLSPHWQLYHTCASCSEGIARSHLTQEAYAWHAMEENLAFVGEYVVRVAKKPHTVQVRDNNGASYRIRDCILREHLLGAALL